MNDDDDEINLSFENIRKNMTKSISVKPLIDAAMNQWDITDKNPWENGSIFNTPVMSMEEKKKIELDVIEKMKLINMLSEEKQCKLVEENRDYYRFIIEPTQALKDIMTFKDKL